MTDNMRQFLEAQAALMHEHGVEICVEMAESNYSAWPVGVRFYQEGKYTVDGDTIRPSSDHFVGGVGNDAEVSAIAIAAAIVASIDN